MGNQNTSGIVEEKEQEANSSPHDQRDENEIVTLVADETSDSQEQAAEADSHDSEADKSPPVETEDHKGSVNEDSETHTAALPNPSSNHIEPKESNSDDKLSELNNEMQDQPSTLKDSDVIPNIDDSNSLPQEAVGITSNPQEAEQNVSPNDTLDINDRDVDNVSSIKRTLLQTRTCEEELGEVNTTDNIGNGIRNEIRVDDPPINSLNELPSIRLQNLSEEEPAENELRNGGKVSCYHQEEPGFEKNKETLEVEIDLLPSLEIVDLLDEVKARDEKALQSNPDEVLVQTEGLNKTAQNRDGDKSEDEMILENAVPRECESSETAEEHESETGNMEKCISQSQSSAEIEQETEFKPAINPQALCSTKSEAEIQISPLIKHNEMPVLGDIEKLDNVSIQKSPSFDFGLPFDARCEESDQTPLLYNNKSTFRSFSSSSTLRFQNRSVQTEYLGNALHYEAVEVEEKTIRMERSNSESLRALSLNSTNKKENSNVVTEAKEDCDIISPKGRGKRKPRSSLFTTCICCIAEIN